MQPYWRTSWPHETDHVLTAGTTKLLVVAFSSCGDEDWAAPPFQWLPTVERAAAGAHLLQVRDLRRQWYLPHAPFAALVDAALASSGASAVLYVGASMGGFAALTALAAASPHRPPARAVVFSPQVAMSRAARERLGDERWGPYVNFLQQQQDGDGAALDLSSMDAAQADVHVDSGSAVDVGHARLLRGAAVVEHPASDSEPHMLARRLRESGELDAIVSQAAERALAAATVEECAICLCPLSRRVSTSTTPCGHSFHHACLARLRAPLCPMCRADIGQFLATRPLDDAAGSAYARARAVRRQADLRSRQARIESLFRDGHRTTDTTAGEATSMRRQLRQLQRTQRSNGAALAAAVIESERAQNEGRILVARLRASRRRDESALEGLRLTRASLREVSRLGS